MEPTLCNATGVRVNAAYSAIFFTPVIPPAKDTSGWMMSTDCVSRKGLNPRTSSSFSPVMIGTRVPRFNAAHASEYGTFQHVLEEQEVQRLDSLGNRNSARGVELAVACDRDVKIIAGSFLHVGVGAMELLQFRGLNGRMKRTLKFERLIDIDLERAEAFGQGFHPLHPILHGGRIVHVLQIVAMRIHRTSIAKRTAEEFVDGSAGDLAGEIPEGDVDTAHGSDRRQKWMLHRGHAEEVFLDGERIAAEKTGVLRHMVNVGARHCHVRTRLAIARKSGIGFDLDDKAVEGVIQCHGFYGGDLTSPS